MTSTLRRLAPCILASLGIGFAAEIAVNWSLRLLQIPRSGSGAAFQARTNPPDRWPGSVPADWPTRPDVISEARMHVASSVAQLGAFRNQQSTNDLYIFWRIESGWPARSLAADGLTAGGANMQQPVSVSLLRRGISIGSPSVVLPLNPIWPGLAINMLFYSALVLAMLISLVRIRRALRLRKGLCPRCAYPMPAAGACPECGFALRAPSPIRS